MNPMLRYFLSLTLKLNGQQSPPHIQLALMRRQPQQGNANRVLVKNNLDTTSVTWRSKFSAIDLQLLCATAQLKLFSITQTCIERFSIFLTKVEYPLFGRRSLNYR